MSERTALTGHLEIVCDVGGNGLTRLKHQRFCAPVHLSKSHYDNKVLIINVVNPTAGFLEGDRLRCNVRVETGARLLLTTPAASRIHAMRGGNARLEQRFLVENGGSLEVWPELLIPQRGARYRQDTRIDLQAGAELLFLETLAPGRVASGETFVFDELMWATDLRLDGRLIARERYCLSPLNGSLDALRRRFPCAYYASAFLAAPTLTARSPCWEKLTALQNDAVWIGVSALAESVFVVKLIAADSVTFRRALRAVRTSIHAALGRPVPDLRRTGEAIE